MVKYVDQTIIDSETNQLFNILDSMSYVKPKNKPSNEIKNRSRVHLENFCFRTALQILKDSDVVYVHKDVFKLGEYLQWKIEIEATPDDYEDFKLGLKFFQKFMILHYFDTLARMIIKNKVGELEDEYDEDYYLFSRFLRNLTIDKVNLSNFYKKYEDIYTTAYEDFCNLGHTKKELYHEKDYYENDEIRTKMIEIYNDIAIDLINNNPRDFTSLSSLLESAMIDIVPKNNYKECVDAFMREGNDIVFTYFLNLSYFMLVKYGTSTEEYVKLAYYLMKQSREKVLENNWSYFKEFITIDNLNFLIDS